jgi:hypothetical protein
LLLLTVVASGNPVALTFRARARQCHPRLPPTARCRGRMGAALPSGATDIFLAVSRDGGILSVSRPRERQRRRRG